MCSILGILDVRTELRELALALSKKQRHRDPDWSGIYTGDGATLLSGGLDSSVIAAAALVPEGKSIACSTPTALAWEKAFADMADPSGRAVRGVHQQSY